MADKGNKGKVSSASRKAYWLSRKDGKVEDINRRRRLARHLRMHPFDVSAFIAIKATRARDAEIAAVVNPQSIAEARERAAKRSTRKAEKRFAA